MTESALASNERIWSLLQHASLDEPVRFANHALSKCKPCRDAAAMAVCELGENLLKYSAPSADLHAGRIGIASAGTQIRIRSINSVATPEDALLVMGLISRITPANVEQLYRARVEELIKHFAAPRARLGVLRVAFEGGFTLSCSYQAPVLEILAERTCRDGG